MIKNTLIIALVIALIYLYYQQRQKPLLSGNPSDPNYQQEVSETVANLKAEAEDLETERDKAIRDKRETEQQLLAINNRLNNKVQETKRKEEEIERLKKENSERDKALNKQIKEKNGLITALNQEKLKLKEDYQKKVKQFDEEQLEGKKLEEQKAQLEQQISQLTTERSNLLKEINKHSELDEFSTWLQADETRQQGLTEWAKVIQEVKSKANNYHLQKGNWKSGWLKNNQEYWEVFQNWLDKD